MSKLIALVDGSVYSESVCDHAGWLASRLDAEVELIHVLGRREAVTSNLSGSIGLGARTKLMGELAELDAQSAKLAQQRGRAILEDAAERTRAAGAPTVTTRLRHGDLVHEVQEREADAEMVVIGKRGEAADFATLHLGSNMERVVRGSIRPVLVAKRAFSPVKTALIAFDGGASALKAIDHVARNPAFADTKCHVLSVGADVPETRRKLDGAAALLRGAGYAVETELAQGAPDQLIKDRADNLGADLLVMGAYGHSRIRNLIIGSTTSEMIRSCQISLLLFR